jgi:hypothetical protein
MCGGAISAMKTGVIDEVTPSANPITSLPKMSRPRLKARKEDSSAPMMKIMAADRV